MLSPHCGEQTYGDSALRVPPGLGGKSRSDTMASPAVRETNKTRNEPVPPAEAPPTRAPHLSFRHPCSYTTSPTLQPSLPDLFVFYKKRSSRTPGSNGTDGHLRVPGAPAFRLRLQVWGLQRKSLARCSHRLAGSAQVLITCPSSARRLLEPCDDRTAGQRILQAGGRRAPSGR